MPHQGYGAGLGPLSNGGNHEGEGLLLRASRKAEQHLQDREYLDFMIPLTEDHLRGILTEWVRH
jgi:hypothetical protein